RLRNSSDWSRIREGLHLPGQIQDFSTSPILSSLWRLSNSSRSEPPHVIFAQALTKMERLQSLLSNQTAETIDAFLVENPDFAPETKVAIGADFFRRVMTRQADGRWAPKDLAARYLPQERQRIDGVAQTPMERNWAHLLINLIRQQSAPTGKV